MDGDGNGEREREREGGESCRLQRQGLGFRLKCQMSQRHSGKMLLFNMSPQSAMEAENLQ